MIKHTQTIRRLLPTNGLSVFDHFVGMALKGLKIQDRCLLLMKLLSKSLQLFWAHKFSNRSKGILTQSNI